MRSILLVICAVITAGGCVSRQADHFYVLDAQPQGAHQRRTAFEQQIVLRVTAPSVVDRGEMVLTTPDGVTILDHERWAAPLADLATTALGQDIEQRRSDVLVLPRSAGESKLPLIKIDVNIDQISARRGNQVSIEAHWRVTDVRGGAASVGRDSFSAPLTSDAYAQVAAGLSSCIGLLADRLILQIPPSPAPKP